MITKWPIDGGANDARIGFRDNDLPSCGCKTPIFQAVRPAELRGKIM
jgi:hypothetical protein